MPEWVMNALALRRSIDFTAYFDPEEPSGFCGVTFTIHSDDLLFVVFLATNPALRSRGYGTRILDQLKERFPGFAIALEIEPMTTDASNFHQRERRLAFYQRNGFVETGLYTDYEGDQYEVLRYLPSRLPGEAHQGMQYADLGVLRSSLEELLASLAIPVYIPTIHVGIRE
ncbi:MAG: GNAT family N-acetyltransferase [Actinomyces sp. oral taxon 181]|nr:GNAT family N-acetyltransferase [Actinomyces sp. oral taxon 181]MBS5750385.1 GNAT family N-acetyltransferase [Actinomyces sp. oral taxon 181]